MSAPVSRSSSQARTSAGFSSSPSKTPFVKWSFLSDLPKEILEIELHLGFGFQRRQGWETRLHCTWQQELCPGNNNGWTLSSEQISKMAFFVPLSSNVTFTFTKTTSLLSQSSSIVSMTSRTLVESLELSMKMIMRLSTLSTMISSFSSSVSSMVSSSSALLWFLINHSSISCSSFNSPA